MFQSDAAAHADTDAKPVGYAKPVADADVRPQHAPQRHQLHLRSFLDGRRPILGLHLRRRQYCRRL
jgi:hypothetical protein